MSNDKLHFQAYDQEWNLKRYPYDAKSQLRAWDAADEYLLNTLAPHLDDGIKLGIVHDNFGALTLPLQAYQPSCYLDSWLANQAITQNLAQNGCETFADEYAPNTKIEDFRPKEGEFDIVIGRVPKHKAQLASLLCQVRRTMREGGLLLLAGMDKHLSRGQFDLLAQYFGEATFLPGVKKARIWQATVDKSIVLQAPQSKSIEVADLGLSLRAGPNVFSRDRLDIGSRFFLEHIKQLPQERHVADLACGNGVLGLAYLKANENAEMYFCDESYQAVQSTSENLQAHFPETLAKVAADDGLKHVEKASFDLVLCNPPFHQQNTVSIDIARSLFKDAHKALRQKGEFWIVANRHLPYKKLLKPLFGQCDQMAANSKFVILRAIKLS